jgi:hypothetical protein
MQILNRLGFLEELAIDHVEEDHCNNRISYHSFKPHFISDCTIFIIVVPIHLKQIIDLLFLAIEQQFR